MTTYVVPQYWMDGYVDESAWQIILLGGARNPWRPASKPPLQQAVPLPQKPKPKPVQRDPVRHQPIPGVKASLAYSVDRGATAVAMKPPQPVASSLIRRK
jgi:hypothetical protein